jgi:hypothetical protein
VLTTADNINVQVGEEVARSGTPDAATFVPSPFTASTAPGCTRTCRLRQQHEHLFDAKAERQLSEICLNYVGHRGVKVSAPSRTRW